MKKLLFYPAVFEKEENAYSVFFPDVPVSTCGNTLEEAVLMAEDALGLYISYLREDKKGLIPPPSDIENIKLENKQFVSIIKLDFDSYLKKYEKKAVKKTLTIPAWLNTAAVEAGLNFSQILQEAIEQRLQRM
jgi:predicted RNase H-like HicB family nuclease